MPFEEHRGQRIHYTVDGTGPLVVLLHGGLTSGATWHDAGYVSGLAGEFTVACIDSLGHGKSDKPTDPALYAQEQRAGDVAAVIAALGHERAHVAGYSMGGWTAVGVAKFHPDRLLSLGVWGWDLVDGMKSAEENARANLGLPDLSFDSIYAAAQRYIPASVAWITKDDIPGLRAGAAAVWELDGAEDAVTALTVPVLLWQGVDDPYHGPMQALATKQGFAHLSSPGDHQTALRITSDETIAAVRAFFAGSFRPPERRVITRRYEFASDEWLAAVEQAIQTCVAEGRELGQLEGVSYSLCEVYEDVPAEVNPVRRVAWSAVLDGEKVTFAREELDDSDLKVVAKYEVLRPIVSIEFGDGPPPEVMEALEVAGKRGEFRMKRAAPSPSAIASLHNRVAAFTR